MRKTEKKQPINKTYLKCNLCQQSYLGFVDSKLNTHAYGGTRIPARQIYRFRKDRNAAAHEMDKKFSSIAHGETQVHVCIFCSQFFTFRKHEMNFHNEMIEHYTHQERIKDIEGDKLYTMGESNVNHETTSSPSNKYEYFIASKAKKNLDVSIDRMIRWKAIDQDPDTYYKKLAEENKSSAI